MASLADDMLRMRGSTVTIWRANATANATAGLDDVSWVSLGTMTAIINELTPQQAETLAGGPINGKLATLYASDTDGATLAIGDLIVTSPNTVWRLDGEPSQPSFGGHYEARLALEPAPPMEVLA